MLPAKTKDESRKTIDRVDVPQVDALYRHYLKGPWGAWSEAERPRRFTIATYNKLFNLHQALLAEGIDYTARTRLGPRRCDLATRQAGSLDIRSLRNWSRLVLIRIGGFGSEATDRLPALETDAYASLEVSGVVPLSRGDMEGLSRSADIALSPYNSTSVAGLLKTLRLGFSMVAACIGQTSSISQTIALFRLFRRDTDRYRYLGVVRAQAVAEFPDRRSFRAAPKEH